MRFYNYFLCLWVIGSALPCYCFNQHQAIYLRNERSTSVILKLSNKLRNSKKSSTDSDDAPRMSRLSRRGNCTSKRGCRSKKSRDSKLMKIPLPNPPLATSPSQSRIAESPFSKIQEPPITRGQPIEGYPFLRANALKLAQEQPNLRASEESSTHIAAFLPAASINVSTRAKSVKRALTS